MKQIKLIFLTIVMARFSLAQYHLPTSDSILLSKDMLEISKIIAPIKKEMEPLSLKYKEESLKYNNAKKDKVSEISLDSMKEHLSILHDEFTPFQDRIKNKILQYIDENPNSYASASVLMQIASALPLDSLKIYYGKLSTSKQQSPFGKYIDKQIGKRDMVALGKAAPDFLVKDIDNNELKLSSFRGRYVLLDFWASWCVPCRKGNPHLKESYAKYHPDGIEFISIASDDGHYETWKAAILKDGIGIWHQALRGYRQPNTKDMSEGKNENSEDLFHKFSVSAIPTKILIDPSGEIIGRYVGDEDKDLDTKLMVIFGK